MQINIAAANTSTLSNSTSCTPPKPILIADSGCSSHFCAPTQPLLNIHTSNTPTHIRLPDGSFMHSTEMGELDIPALPIAARHAHIVPALNGQSLISIGQLFDSGCDVTLNAMTIAVNHEGTPIFHGTRNPATKLWELDASQTEPVEFSNAAIGSPSPENLVALAHAALFSPALTTMETALRKGYLTNFPGLTTRSFRRYPIPTEIARNSQRPFRSDTAKHSIDTSPHNTTHHRTNQRLLPVGYTSQRQQCDHFC